MFRKSIFNVGKVGRISSQFSTLCCTKALSTYSFLLSPNIQRTSFCIDNYILAKSVNKILLMDLNVLSIYSLKFKESHLPLRLPFP